MSPDMERLIGRSVVDKDFRDKLIADPEGTVNSSGLNLTPDEMDSIKRSIDSIKQSLSPDQIDAQFGMRRKGYWA